MINKTNGYENKWSPKEKMLWSYIKFYELILKETYGDQALESNDRGNFLANIATLSHHYCLGYCSDIRVYAAATTAITVFTNKPVELNSSQFRRLVGH